MSDLKFYGLRETTRFALQGARHAARNYRGRWTPPRAWGLVDGTYKTELSSLAPVPARHIAQGLRGAGLPEGRWFGLAGGLVEGEVSVTVGAGGVAAVSWREMK